MGTPDVSPIELPLDADHPVPGKLVVTTNLAAADKGAVRFRAVNCWRRADDANLIYAGLILLGPATADIAADVAAGSVVDHHRRRHRPGRLDGHIGRRSGTDPSDS
jgi:hypothetical protein